METIKVTYNGDSPACDIPSIGVFAVRGEPVDVPAAVAHELIARGAEWKPPRGYKPPAASDNAAAPATSDNEGDS